MYKILLGIFFLLFSPSFSYAGQYVFTHYSSKDGLSSNYIHDIAQDRNGFIWIATHFGISRFNGTTFHNFLSTDYPSMYRDDIYHAFVMKHGAVTFGSSKGTIVSYNNRQDNFTDYAPTDSFYHDITGYTLCLDGEELVSTSAGVYTYCENAGKLQFLPVVPKGTAVYEVFKDHWQHYWLGLNRGVALYNRTGEKVNGFEERVIQTVADLDSVLFWHRNPERAKGFYINGFINHYPDFIVKMRSGKTVLIETKGDFLDNDESRRKRVLGQEWERLGGRNYRYFMVFEDKKVDGAWTLNELLDVLKNL